MAVSHHVQCQLDGIESVVSIGQLMNKTHTDMLFLKKETKKINACSAV